MSPAANFPARVLMTADAVGGVWQYALELSAGLSRRGISVLLAVSGPAPSAAQQTAVSRIRGLTLRHRPYRLEWMENVEEDLDDEAAWLTDLGEELDPDFVHLNGYAMAACAWDVPIVVVCHSCVRTWWRAVHGEAAPAEWAEYAERVARGLIAADLVVAPTRSFLDAIEAEYGSPPQTMVIANGRSGPFRADIAKQPLIFSCGRAWDRAKGLDRLEALVRRVPWPVYLAGDVHSPDGGGATDVGRVRTLGRLDEEQVAAWMARASIFVLPARYEPFGLAVLEAAMSGCALVLGDIDTLRELWDGAALFADPEDEDALAEVTARLIDDRGLCRAMAARAVRRAQRYRAVSMADAYLSAYRRAFLLRNLRGGVRGAIVGAEVAERRA